MKRIKQFIKNLVWLSKNDLKKSAPKFDMWYNSITGINENSEFVKEVRRKQEKRKGSVPKMPDPPPPPVRVTAKPEVKAG